jgi:hypothetical protein
MCECGHEHGTVTTDGHRSVFHRCRAPQCDCNLFRFAPDPALTIDHARAIRLMMEYVRTFATHSGGVDWMAKADEAAAIIERETHVTA